MFLLFVAMASATFFSDAAPVAASTLPSAAPAAMTYKSFTASELNDIFLAAKNVSATHIEVTILHQTKKISLIVDSSMESEAIASSKAGEVVAYVREVLRAFGVPLDEPTLIGTDNLANLDQGGDRRGVPDQVAAFPAALCGPQAEDRPGRGHDAPRAGRAHGSRLPHQVGRWRQATPVTTLRDKHVAIA